MQIDDIGLNNYAQCLVYMLTLYRDEDCKEFSLLFHNSMLSEENQKCNEKTRNKTVSTSLEE